MQQAIVEGAGADTDPEAINQTSIDYLKMFEAVSQTYGRTLKIVTIEATGGPTDATAAQADAQKVIDMKAFAAVGGPAQTPAFFQELVAAKIMCMCATAQPQSVIESRRRTSGRPGRLLNKRTSISPSSSASSSSARRCSTVHRAAGQDARWLGAGRNRDRPVLPATTPSTRRSPTVQGQDRARSTYLYDANNAANIASTVIANEAITTVLISTDPLIPKQITQEATKQNYFLKWVIGPSVPRTRRSSAARTTRSRKHALGLGLTRPARPRSTTPSRRTSGSTART